MDLFILSHPGVVFVTFVTRLVWRLLRLQRERNDSGRQRGGGRGPRVRDRAGVVGVGGGDLLVGVGAAGVGRRQSAGAALAVPRELALFAGAAWPAKARRWRINAIIFVKMVK